MLRRSRTTDILAAYALAQTAGLFFLRNLYLLTVYQTVLAYFAVSITGIFLFAACRGRLAGQVKNIYAVLWSSFHGMIVLGFLTNGVFNLTLTQMTLIQCVNFFLGFTIYWIPYMMSGRRGTAVAIGNGIIGFLGVLNHYLVRFRGAPFQISDIRAARTAQNVVKKDLFDLTAADLEQYDAVVDAFGAWTEDVLPQHSTSLKHLCDILSGKKTRLLVVGGAGSLYVNPEHTVQVCDGADFPAMFLPLAKAQGKALSELRERNDVQWTFISPAGDFQAEGERTGEYILAGEELTLNEKGESIISYADYAIAMVDEVTNGNHIQERISVVRK